jgi:all-trans-retinol 13,14-reductase
LTKPPTSHFFKVFKKSTHFMPKSKFTTAFKKQLIPKTHFLTFQTDSELDFNPGQFFSLEVAPKTFRAYSTVEVSKNPPSFFSNDLKTLDKGNYVSFMISTKPGGPASEYFENIEAGEELNAIGPSGKFSLHTSQKAKVFIATGTGLAPFVPMIKDVFAENKEAEVYLFFAVWDKPSDFAMDFFKEFYNNPEYPNFKIYTVIDEPKESDLDEFNLGGRVTTEVPKIISDIPSYDYYLCGHPAMVTAMNEVLEQNGATGSIYMEKFGK